MAGEKSTSQAARRAEQPLTAALRERGAQRGWYEHERRRAQSARFIWRRWRWGLGRVEAHSVGVRR